MRVYGYCRVSSEEQATSGQSLAVQAEKIRLYCRLHDLELVELVEDAGFSAKNLRRPGIQRILEGLAAGTAEGLVIPKLDRLSRSVRDWSHLIETYFSEKAGRSLLSVEDSIDTRTAGGRLVLYILGAVGQWEREAIGERTRAVLRSKASRGEPVSRAPRGWRIVREGVSEVSRGKAVRIETDPEEIDGRRIAARARKLREQGLALRAIAERLEAEGYRPERGRRFYASTVRAILRNGRTLHAVA